MNPYEFAILLLLTIYVGREFSSVKRRLKDIEDKLGSVGKLGDKLGSVGKLENLREDIRGDTRHEVELHLSRELAALRKDIQRDLKFEIELHEVRTRD